MTDFELAKQDLFNHLHIRKGEKLMNPNFGTIIWDLLFEQLTPAVKTAITDDLTAIVRYDPRFILNGINVIEYEHGIQADLDITYVPTNQTETLRIAFDKNSAQ